MRDTLILVGWTHVGRHPVIIKADSVLASRYDERVGTVSLLLTSGNEVTLVAEGSMVPGLPSDMWPVHKIVAGDSEIANCLTNPALTVQQVLDIRRHAAKTAPDAEDC